MSTAACTQCDKKFNKKTQLLANQALRMHVGRTHDKNIDPSKRSSAPVQSSNGSNGSNGSHVAESRGHLNNDEMNALVGFLREHHKDYPTRQACFTAALEACALQSRIKNNSGAVARYFDKIKAAGKTETGKRKYVKRSQAPVVQEVKVNFCPNCGCNIHAVATGIAMATHIKT